MSTEEQARIFSSLSLSGLPALKDVFVPLTALLVCRANGSQTIDTRELLDFSETFYPTDPRNTDRLVVRKISAGTLSILFNESLAAGQFSLDFKTGNTIPLMKPGKKDNAAPWKLPRNNIEH